MFEDMLATGATQDYPQVPEEPPCHVTPESLNSLKEWRQAHDLALMSIGNTTKEDMDQGSTSQLQSQVTAGPYFLHIAVFKVPTMLCRPPCNTPSWERAAKKPAKGSTNYQLLEVAIWDHEQRVAMYEFDEDWEKKSNFVPNEICNGKWRCDEYVTHREKAKIWEAKIPPSLKTHNGMSEAEKESKDKQKSTWFANKFKEVLAIAAKRNAQNWGLTYAGHGARANGALFEGMIYKEDAQAVLTKATAGKKAAFLNFGGNCAEGKWNMVQALHPYADYIVASDLLVTGVNGVPRDKIGPYMSLKSKNEELRVIQPLMQARTSIEKVLGTLLAKRQEIWAFVKEEIAKNKLKQSKSLYKCSAFPPLKSALEIKWNALMPDARFKIEETTEKARCDAKVFVKEVGGKDPNFLRLYTDFRIQYIDTSAYFKWDVATQGFSFNFMGYKAPPCDISAFGEGKQPPSCITQSSDFQAQGAPGGCSTYEQGAPNHEKCGIHVDKNTGKKAQDVCKQCGVCMPAMQPCKKMTYEAGPGVFKERPFVGPVGDCTWYASNQRACRDQSHTDVVWMGPGPAPHVTAVCPQCKKCRDGPAEEQSPPPKKKIPKRPAQPVQKKENIPTRPPQPPSKKVTPPSKKDTKPTPQPQPKPKPQRKRRSAVHRRRRRRRRSSGSTSIHRRRRRTGIRRRRRKMRLSLIQQQILKFRQKLQLTIQELHEMR